MHIIETDRLVIKSRYDLEESKAIGEVCSKIEGKCEVQVGTVTEEPKGTSKLHLFKEYKGKDYIVEDYEKLRGQFVEYANMWTARASRGMC